MGLEEDDDIEIKMTSTEDSTEVNIMIRTSAPMAHVDLIAILEDYVAELNMDYYKDSHGSKMLN